MFRPLGFMFVLCLVSQPSFGDDSSKVLGTWKLVSYETEVQATGAGQAASNVSVPMMLPDLLLVNVPGTDTSPAVNLLAALGHVPLLVTHRQVPLKSALSV
jgi:hypothetical protein